MKTTVVQIGNSDNKLTQAQWAEFVKRVGEIVNTYATHIHFFGGSPNWERWQNVAWVAECADYMIPNFKDALSGCKQEFYQDSIAYSESETLFL